MGSRTLGYDFLTGCLEEVYKDITHTVRDSTVKTQAFSTVNKMTSIIT